MQCLGGDTAGTAAQTAAHNNTAVPYAAAPVRLSTAVMQNKAAGAG